MAACGSPPTAARDAGPDAPIDATPDGTGVPDLTVHLDRAKIDLAIGSKDFAADACELDPDEACVGGPGVRQLLWFSVESPNVGTGDITLGQPSAQNPAFQFSQCHEHFHFVGYADYELLDGGGASVAVGRKQAFCLVDTRRFVDEPGVADRARYTCLFQGIQRGWSDVYGSRLPCQFLDITDVTPGQYTLRVEINRDQALEELDYTNNILELPIDLTDPDLAGPTEACEAGLDARATGTVNRECGWQSAGTFSCTPGGTFNVGCNDSCGNFSLGSCTGDPMMRVCDASQPDGNCSHPSALTFDDDSCQNDCPLETDVPCPDSGMVEVFVAPKVPGDPVDCSVEVADS